MAASGMIDLSFSNFLTHFHFPLMYCVAVSGIFRTSFISVYKSQLKTNIAGSSFLNYKYHNIHVNIHNSRCIAKQGTTKSQHKSAYYLRGPEL